jgi:hypothetical protein
VTVPSAPAIDEASGTGETLHCYRHPDRETWVKCGRCDRPICPRCAIQGPVGLRCKQCGKPAFDPLTSFTATQFVLGVVVAILSGAAAGFFAARIGFFSIIVAYFAGGLIAEIVMRVTGYKHGPVMLAIVLGGILLGSTVGAVAAFLVDYGTLLDAVGAAPGAAEYVPVQSFIVDAATWAVAAAAAACFGAWQKLRF